MALATAASATTTATVSAADELAALAGQWDELVLAMPRPSPFLLHGWVEEWWRHYGDGRELAIHVAHADGRLVGALPLVVESRAGLRIASFIGGRVAVLPDLLLAPAAPPDTAERLLERLDATGSPVLDLHGLPEDSRIAAALGDRLDLVQRIEAPVLDLTAGWEAVYRSKTTSKKRNLHRRRRRQLGELGHLTVDVARDLDELAPALEDAFRLHRLRWEGRPDGSGFGTDVGVRFHRAALRRLAAIGIPRIVTLRLDGRAIAFHYYFALERGMYVHRLAFDPALSRWSPGLVNTLDAIEAAADEGLTRVEFLGGGERYKLELADGMEPLYHGFGGAAGIAGRVYAGAQVATIRARLRLKRSPRLHRLYFDDLAPARKVVQRASRALRRPGGR